MSVPLVAQAPPLMLTCGLPSPLTVTAAPSLMPLMVSVLAVVRVLRAMPLWSVKLKGSGMKSAARVVTSQVSLTPPTVTVVLRVVLKVAALVKRTARVWLFMIVPLVAQAPPAILICGLPSPVTVTGEAPSMAGPSPVMVTAVAVRRVLKGTLVWSVKVKALGTVSCCVCTVQAAVQLKLASPTVTVASR